MASTQRTANRSHRTDQRSRYYVQGNVVRKVDVTREIKRQPQKKISNTARKNREKAKHMNAGYVFFLCAALVATGIILVNYIGLQSLQELGMQYAEEGQIITFASETNDYVKQMADIPK